MYMPDPDSETERFVTGAVVLGIIGLAVLGPIGPVLTTIGVVIYSCAR